MQRICHQLLISRRLFEQMKQRLESHPKSIEQRQHFSRLNTHGRTWNGQRSRFILSGLMKCSLCGSRYQGITRDKGKKWLDGTRVKTFYYGCGGYIAKGRSICEMNAIPQKALEETVGCCMGEGIRRSNLLLTNYPRCRQSVVLKHDANQFQKLCNLTFHIRHHICPQIVIHKRQIFWGQNYFSQQLTSFCYPLMQGCFLSSHNLFLMYSSCYFGPRMAAIVVQTELEYPRRLE